MEENMKSKTVQDIVIDYLNKHDFDGLAGENCGCEISDLMTCDDQCPNCVPAYKVKPIKNSEWADCEWVMSPSKKGRIK
jgi:hypothetical protein